MDAKQWHELSQEMSAAKKAENQKYEIYNCCISYDRPHWEELNGSVFSHFASMLIMIFVNYCENLMWCKMDIVM